MGNMIDEKYKGKYKGASDWIGSFIEQHCAKEDGTVDIDKLRDLAAVNGFDTKHLKTDNATATGRLRMTVGNTLRSRAKKRGGLYAPDGTEARAPADFLGDGWAATENMKGESLKVEKPAKPAKAPKADKGE